MTWGFINKAAYCIRCMSWPLKLLGKYTDSMCASKLFSWICFLNIFYFSAPKRLRHLPSCDCKMMFSLSSVCLLFQKLWQSIKMATLESWVWIHTMAQCTLGTWLLIGCFLHDFHLLLYCKTRLLDLGTLAWKGCYQITSACLLGLLITHQ